MRQAITLTKKRNGQWEMTSGPEVPYGKQRQEFNSQPGPHMKNPDAEQIKLVRIDRDNTKTRHYVDGGEPKAAKKKATK